MSRAQETRIQPQTPSLAMLRTLGGIAMLSGLLVVLAFQSTQSMIEENKRVAIEKAISQVIPGVATKKVFLLGPDGLFPADATEGGAGEKIYAAYDAKAQLKGIALEAAATGYQDVIRILYGYNQDCQCVTGIKVLKMAETPGLGDKIASDPEFLTNFKTLDGRLNKQRSALKNPIVTVKHGTKREQWEIDAISGATISSKAVGRMINASAQRMFPLIIAHLGELRAGQEQVR